MPRQVFGFSDAEALAAFAAQEFVRRAAAAIRERGVFRVALAGGQTPRRTHEALTRPPLRNRVDWTSVQFFFGDERAVPPDHPDSNFNAARLALLDQLPLHASQVHRLAGERGDLDGAAREYAADLGRSFGVPQGPNPPRFDLVFLGMGKDGHTASLFPFTEALGEARAWVVRNEVPQLDTTRLTFTYPVLNAALAVLFMVSGHDKAEALERVLEGPPNLQQFPAQGVKPDAGDLIWLVDEAAAGRLRETPASPPSL